MAYLRLPNPFNCLHTGGKGTYHRKIEHYFHAVSLPERTFADKIEKTFKASHAAP